MTDKQIKYIVKNCPTFNENKMFYYSCKNLNVEPIDCQDCTDCIIKQVIEKCKQIENECPCEFQGFDCWECHISGQKSLAQQILQLFEIEECDNDR